MKLTPEQLRQTADAIEAVNAGKPVQYQDSTGEWRDSHDPVYYWSFDGGLGYRPKPEPVTRPWSKPEDVPGPVCYIKAANEASGWMMIISASAYDVSVVGRMPFESLETIKPKSGKLGYLAAGRSFHRPQDVAQMRSDGGVGMNSKLNPNAQAWVAALRSGEYKQGKGMLVQKTHDGTVQYCCLGVACDLAIKSGQVNGRIEFKHLSGRVFIDGRSAIALMPLSVRAIMGVATGDGTISETSLADLNDKGKTFPEIADIIESAPEGLFVEVAE